MTNKNNAFTSFLGSAQQNHQNANGNTRSTNPSAPSVKQIAAYKQLCERKRVEAVDVSTFSKAELSKMIDELIARPFPPTEPQMTKITELIAELNANGVRINLSEEKLASLTGGQEGTASQLIEFLFKKKQEAGIVDGISDKQVEILVEWFLCPSIPFEDFGVSKRVLLPEISETAWRLVTPAEFEASVRENINREEASRVIDQYRAEFYAWKQTRITQKQIQFIQTLESRLANTFVPRESNVSMDHNGDIVFKESSMKDVYAPNGYEAMDVLLLAQLSADEARTHITHLQNDLSDRVSLVAYDERQQEMQDKLGTYNELRQTGGLARGVQEARVLEYHKLNDILFALDASAGMENDVLHAKLSETVLDGKGHADQFAREFKEYMLSTIHTKTMKADIGRLRSLCEASEVATAMFEEALAELLG